MSCPYKDVLGKPGEGFHSTRFMGLAVGDTLATFVGAYFLAKAFGFDYLPTLLVFFIMGELMHMYFCVDTAFLKLTGLPHLGASL
jgi:hypothetical protein